MGLKYLALNDTLYRYVCRNRSDSNDPILRALRKETESLGDISRMQISEEQGAFMQLLVAAINARSVIEVGTFTGYSSLCMARALPDNGKLICVDASKEWTDIARKYWKKAGLNRKIELRLGSAVPILQKLQRKLMFDLAFIDAEKTEYDAYVADLVNYLVYLGEPAATKRVHIGMIVMLFLFVMLALAYALKHEYWKDIH